MRVSKRSKLVGVAIVVVVAAIAAVVLVNVLPSSKTAVRTTMRSTTSSTTSTSTTSTTTTELALPTASPSTSTRPGAGGAVSSTTTTVRTTTTSPPTTTAPSTTTSPPTTSAGVDPSILAAGDIASCSSSGDEATASLLDANPGATVLTLGDNVYDDGTPEEFAKCYDPSWGRAKNRTKPSPGNHEYGTSGASGYFGYFGRAAGDPSKGYYSFDLGNWHIVSLNSNCDEIDCTAGSAQERWLRADLAAHPKPCTLAYWHHPRYSSGDRHGSDDDVQALFQALYEHGADLVLQGHEHNYERFAPMNARGEPDAARGIRSFVVGTGGKNLYGFAGVVGGSEIRNNSTFGVLKVTLRSTSYDWKFLPVAGHTFSDAGTQACH